MIDQPTNSNAISGQSEFLQLLEQITDLMVAGKDADCRQLMAEHPQYASELEAVLPAIQMMHDVQSTDATGVGSAARLPEGDPHLSLQGRLGDFQIIREIGRGGMGVVYEAEQLLLGRRVALKVLPLAGMLDQRQRTRFQNEARAAATLNHPHIVPIYFVGVERGIHFFAMQYIPGRSLADVIHALRSSSGSHGDTAPATTGVDLQAELSTQREGKRRPEFFRSVARLGLQVAEALQHAHDRGIVHRDIKPSNLLLDDAGKCVITDFGLARLEGDSQITMTGDVIGTLRYAAPEQMLGEPCQVDHRADIYALGATLYELLSLRPVKNAESREQLMQQSLEAKPRPVRKHDAAIPLDLETIVHKALDRDADDRYQSAASLAEDLRRFLAGRPLLSRRPHVAQRMTKWVKRHPRSMITTVAVLLLFLSGTAMALFALNHERLQTAEQRDTAQANLQLAIAALDEVYHEVGSNWIASDRNLSNTQAHFLRRSAKLLTEIAERFPPDTEFSFDAGLAHLHAANANARTLNFDAAASGYDRACALLGQTLEKEPGNASLRETLAAAEYRRAELCMRCWRFDQARRSLQVAAEHMQHLLASDPSHESRLIGLLSIETELLRLASLTLQDEHVVQKGSRLRLRLEQLASSDPDRDNLQQVNLQLVCLISQSLRRLRRSDEALKLCNATLQETAFPLQDFHDHREIERTIAACIAELGRCQIESQLFPDAEKNLRKAMSRLRRSFLFDGTPKEYSLAYLKHEVTHDLMEPDAFVQYARAQAALAEVLAGTGRQDEAFVHADEAVRTCLTQVNLFPELPTKSVDAAECALALAGIESLSEEAAARRRELLEIILNAVDQARTDSAALKHHASVTSALAEAVAEAD